MSEVELSRLHGIINGLRAELASFKENGCDGCELPLWWAEAIKLRAELAAEKERADTAVKILKWCVEYDGECLGDNPSELNDAKAAIRASNAAPPQPIDETASELKKHIKEAEDKFYVLSFYINDPVANKCALDKCNQMRRALGKAPMDFGPDMVHPRDAAPPHVEPSAADTCKHCNHGHFDDQRYGCDVECVNGVLIDIDVASEGWQKDVSYPLAPCHLNFANEDQEPNDCQERLAAWAAPKEPSAAEVENARLHTKLSQEIGDPLPSAAESEAKQCISPHRCFWPNCDCRTATEARMIELARGAKYATEIAVFNDNSRELAALVIETYGKEK